MYDTYSVIFFPKSSNGDKLGKVPIYLRITANGKRCELSIKRKIPLKSWNSNTASMRGTTVEAGNFNRYLNSIRSRIDRIYEDLTKEKNDFTVKTIRDIYTGKSIDKKMLLEIFQTHNDQVESLIGKDFAYGTFERYRTAKKHVEEYIAKEYKLNDIPVKDVDHSFITGLEYYLKTERKCGHNTAVKYITNFKKIIRIALANNWITLDPFLHWKAKLKIVDREFLTEGEIQKLIEKEFHTERLDLVKNIFLFSCFTGLAYADVKKLSPNNVVIGIDGNKWIKVNRTKTDSRTNIPLLPTALEIIKKYSDFPSASAKLLPILTNQKMNAYLKEIADLCEIEKNLTFHLARHTFATTVTLLNGVPIESVSKMLGHKNLKTTQHYAKILDQKVSEDMLALRSRLMLRK
ncbi:site-specific integrase [Christiangramia echinicola]|uniref:Site-specific recombinase XerD n=1 Tax=Christiangramia echinicola TaxID=279359 RepID=A0A1H1L099_9FLAO|nr:site-specific integrase [Christiangramia echinicola]SDR67692.1 Site-specific recombinase XerD [Christiangramia echinicola]